LKEQSDNIREKAGLSVSKNIANDVKNTLSNQNKKISDDNNESKLSKDKEFNINLINKDSNKSSKTSVNKNKEFDVNELKINLQNLQNSTSNTSNYLKEISQNEQENKS